MKKIAIISDGKVTNLMALDHDAEYTPPPGELLVDVTDIGLPIGPGWEYDSGQFTNPFLPDPTPIHPPYPQLTALQVLDLFTEQEQLAVVEATMSVAAVKLWYDRLIASTFTTYEDPRTEAGLAALVAAGLLTEQRKAEIVASMLPGQ